MSRSLWPPLLLLLLLLVTTSNAWISSTTITSSLTPRHSITITRHSSTRLFGSTNSDNSNNADDDDAFMKALRSRISEVQDHDTQVPIMVLDSMLPRQVLKLEVDNDIFQKLIQHLVETDQWTFGMVGMATLTTGQTLPLQNGVQVTLQGLPKVVDALPRDDTTTVINPATSYNNQGQSAVRVKFQAGRRFRILQEHPLTTHPTGGWTQARVQFLDSTQEERDETPPSLATAIQIAQDMDAPIQEWIQLAKQNERFPGQIDQLLVDLGAIPPATEPTERALWVGALINPLPGMGVAMEIRPSLLMAQTAHERVLLALKAMEASIQHMNGTKKLF